MLTIEGMKMNFKIYLCLLFLINFVTSNPIENENVSPRNLNIAVFQ